MFNRFWGFLSCSKIEREKNSKSIFPSICDDKQLCVKAVFDPFLMQKRNNSDGWRTIKHYKFATYWAKTLTWLSKHCYPLAYLCSRIRLGLLDNAGDAAMFYYNVYPNFKKQRTLCLPRAIFIATTSKRFKEHGVMFIGSFLPTVRMHAWVVEDGSNADVYDGQWICFKPVMMMI